MSKARSHSTFVFNILYIFTYIYIYIHTTCMNLTFPYHSNKYVWITIYHVITLDELKIDTLSNFHLVTCQICNQIVADWFWNLTGHYIFIHYLSFNSNQIWKSYIVCLLSITVKFLKTPFITVKFLKKLPLTGKSLKNIPLIEVSLCVFLCHLNLWFTPSS